MSLRAVLHMVVCLGVGSLSATARAELTKDGCIDANEEAQALRAEGKLRRAQEELSVCVSPSCPAVVRDDCAQRLDEVQRALPTLVFDVRGGGGGVIGAVLVKMDGATLTARLDGSGLVVDPGRHVFRFEAAGFVGEDQALMVLEGVKARDVGVVLRPVSPPSRTSPTHVVSFALLGLGLDGLLAGSVFGVRALTDKSALSGECNGAACRPGSQMDIDALHVDSTVADVGLFAGMAALGAGAALYFVSRPTLKAPALAAAWVGPRAVGVGGVF